MRFYQLHRTHEAGTSSGYQYFASLREAQMACTHWCRDKQLEHDAEIKIIDIEPTKRSILYALNRYASHADNG